MLLLSGDHKALCYLGAAAGGEPWSTQVWSCMLGIGSGWDALPALSSPGKCISPLAGSFALLGLVLVGSCAVVPSCISIDSEFLSSVLFCELCAFMDFKAHLSAWEEIKKSCFKLGIAFSGCKLIAKLETNSRGQLEIRNQPQGISLEGREGSCIFSWST